MLQALHSAASGMIAQQLCMDVTAENLANISTSGFKSSSAEFADLLYAQRAVPNGQISIGTGSRLIDVRRDFAQGLLEQTGNAYSVAIEGDGFLQVKLADGGTGYTRCGNLGVDAGGRVKVNGRYYLEPPVTLPKGATGVTIEEDGRVIATLEGGKTKEAGRITLTSFTNPNGLIALGDGVFVAGPTAGTATTDRPGKSGLGGIRQGCIERSNVDVATEMTRMIVAMRAYQMNSKVLQNADEALSNANGILRR